ncbi:MAG: mechanosensitive ion channel family protein [Elusimicrobia bacterium]|nr:mechanosensitive ion channel family protein [Elusimicrobiota bacterium]
MRKILSVALSASLVLASAAPAFAVEGVVKGEGKAPLVLPIIKVDTQLAPGVDQGLGRLSVLPAVNSADAQAIDAAALLGPALATLFAPGAELTAPGAGSIVGPHAADFNAAIEATAEDAQAEAGVTATAQLDRVESAALTGEKSTQDRAWTGLRDSVSGVPVMTSGPVSRFSLLRSRTGRAVAGTSAVLLGSAAAQAATETAAKAVPAAPAVMPHWLTHFATQYAPYLTAAAAGLGLWLVNKGATWIVGKIADWRGADADGKKTAQLVTSMSVWGLGTLAALHFGGAPAWVTENAASLIPAGVTIASKYVIGNAVEASKVLFYHSFIIGDRIKLGTEIYKVEDLTLTEVILRNEAFPNGSPTPLTYLQLAGEIITVLRPYEADRKITLEKPKVSPLEAGGMVMKTLGSASRKTWLWLGGGAAAAIAATMALPLLAAFPFLVTVLSLVKGAAIFASVHSVRSLVVDFISRFGEKAGWHPQTTRVVKFVAEILSYSVGGTWGLGAAGTSFTALLKGSVATGFAFTLVTQDILSNLIQAFRLKRQKVKGRKSFKIGDWILVNGILGKVSDMNLQYVILAHEDGTHSLISFAILKDSKFTSFSNPEDLAIAKKRFPPPASTGAAKTPAPVSLGDRIVVGGVAGKVLKADESTVTLQTGDPASAAELKVSLAELKAAGYAFVPSVLPQPAPDSK